MEPLSYWSALAGVLFVYMNLWFAASVVMRRNDVADMAWGMGFALLAWTSFALAEPFSIRGLIIGTLVSIWGIRLAVYIGRRNKGRGEDYRYLAWRQAWGKWFYLRSYFQVFMLQGALLFIIALPITMTNFMADSPLNYLDVLGCVVWAVGFMIEAEADAQLAAFVRNPRNKGRLMRYGLWKYSRHPNYFGEVLLWWGIWLIAISAGWAWLTVIGPLTITFLILKVSGIPLLEQRMAQKPEFAEYRRTTSKFIPWFVGRVK